MGFKVGDVVQLKEKFAGRKYKGKVLRVMPTASGKILVVSQPNNLTANFPEELWELVKEDTDNEREDN